MVDIVLSRAHLMAVLDKMWETFHAARVAYLTVGQELDNNELENGLDRDKAESGSPIRLTRHQDMVRDHYFACWDRLEAFCTTHGFSFYDIIKREE